VLLYIYIYVDAIVWKTVRSISSFEIRFRITFATDWISNLYLITSEYANRIIMTMSIIILEWFSLVAAINYRCLTSRIVSLWCPTNASAAVTGVETVTPICSFHSVETARREKRGSEATMCNKTRTWTAMCRSKCWKMNECCSRENTVAEKKTRHQ